MRSFRRFWPAVMMAPLAAWLLSAGTGPLASWSRGGEATKGRTDAVMVVYVGADDCAPCRKFYEEQWPAIRNSARLSSIAFREVRSPTFRDVLSDEYWTADLRPIRDTLPDEAGVPLWVVVSDGSVVKSVWGVSQWEAQVMPLLRRIAAQ